MVRVPEKGGMMLMLRRVSEFYDLLFFYSFACILFLPCLSVALHFFTARVTKTPAWACLFLYHRAVGGRCP